MRVKNEQLFQDILWELKVNNCVTELYISNKYGYSERTIRRYFKILKDNNIIELIRKGKNRQWTIIK